MDELPFALIEQARDTISSRIRKTPMLEVEYDTDRFVSMKLECLQISGSFKIRGALNTVLGLDQTALNKGLVTASGGNHGLGVATAGAMTDTPATIYLPESTPPSKVEKLKNIATNVIVSGSAWDDANELALEDAKTNAKTYVHPFADLSVMAGQGTLGLEILEEAPDLDNLIVAIGGGGLISGVATAIKSVKPKMRIIGVEATGAPTLRKSVDAGKLVTLEKVETRAGTLAPRRSEEINLSIISKLVDDIILVEDAEMLTAAQWLWGKCGIGVELSAAAALAILQSGRFTPEPGQKTGIIICGTGTDGF